MSRKRPEGGGLEPRPPLTPEEKEARAQRARENGRKGGRPPKTAWNKEQKLRAEARARGESALVACVDYWIELVEGRHSSATHDHRLRAAENLANRCGLPIRTEQGVTPGLPVKAVSLFGWVDASGTPHKLEPGAEAFTTADDPAEPSSE